MVDAFKDVLAEVVKVVRCATSLGAQDVKFHRSLDPQLALKIDASGERLLSIANRVIEASVPGTNPLPFGEDKFTWKQASEVLDLLFEKVDIEFDSALRNNSRSDVQYLEEGPDAGRLGKVTTKPQEFVKIPVDNLESHPFKPKITSKPNAMVSFEKSTALVHEEEDPDHYNQPYETEILQQPYPDSILHILEPIPSQDWKSTSAIWVETPEQLAVMIADLEGVGEIAVDLEHHDYRTYYGIVCLMQISSREKDWIVDTIKLRDDLEPLNSIFTDPQVVKVFHGAFMDIIWLQRDLGLYVVSLFDTYHALKKLGFPKFSLAYLLETYANFKTSKKYQLADWRLRPLPSPMMAYARSDTHFLLNIYDQMRNKLLSAKDGAMQEVLANSRDVAKRRFEFTKYRPTSTLSNGVCCPVMTNNTKEPYQSIMLQYNVPRHRRSLVSALYEWRDQTAKKADESVRYIMPNQFLVSLSLLPLPISSQSVFNASSHVPEAVRVHVSEIVHLIQETHQHMEEDDWEEVEKLSNSVGNDSAFINNEQPDTSVIQFIGEAFKNLESVNQSSCLLNETSFLLSNILERQPEFSIEYDSNKHKIIKHNSNEVKERQDKIEEYFNSCDLNVAIEQPKIDENLQNSPELIVPETEVVETEVVEKTPDFFDSSKEELISLRKRAKFRDTKKGKKDDEPVIDYLTADKIMIENTSRKKDSKKKRSFNPYAEMGEGPKGAKKAKRNNTGRTTTFRS